MIFYPLYIDPGTGSALFSIIIGIIAVIVFSFQAVFLKIKLFFTGGKAKTGAKNKFVIYAEDKRYWPLFKPIAEEFENRNIELLYLTASKDDPVFNYSFQYVKPEYLGEGNKAFSRLNFLSADLVLATTPGLDVYQWKRSKNVKHYSHILHMADEPLKYEFFGMDYFDSVLVSGGEFQESSIRKLENIRNLPQKQVVTVGCSYLDEYSRKMEKIPPEENHIFTVLVSPSWGKSALLSKHGEKLLAPLANKGWKIIVRPHPQSLTVEKEIIDNLSARFSDNPNLEWDFEIDNIYSLKKADVMVSDFSGIILDYMFLCDKPVFYVAEKYDWRTRELFQIYKEQDEIWIFKKLKNAGKALDPDSLENLPELIEKASSDTSLKAAIKDVKDEAWHYRGNAGKNTADFMIKTAEALSA